MIIQGVNDLNHHYIDSWLDRIADDSGAPMRERWVAARRLTREEAGDN